jgi:hypothetical protein
VILALYVPFRVAVFLLAGVLVFGGGAVGWTVRGVWEATR